MALDYAPAPIRDPIAEENPETKKLMLPRVWIDWFAALGMRVERQTEVMDVTEIFSQSGPIGTTPIATDTLNEGLFRLTFYLRVIAVAATSSSLTVRLGWVDGAVACYEEFPPATGNTTGETQSGTVMVRNDQGSPLTYSVAYASVPANQMHYNFYVMVERIA